MRTLSLLVPILLAGCGSAERTLLGEVPAGAEEVFAIDGDGNRYDAAVEGSSFELRAPADVPYVLMITAGDLPYVLRFERSAGGAFETTLPAWTGTVDVGMVSLVSNDTLRDATTTSGDDWAECEENPLSQIDTDDDGEDDFEDEDDDDDAIPDHEDCDDHDDDRDDEDEGVDAEHDDCEDGEDREDDDGGEEDDGGEDEDEDEDEEEDETETESESETETEDTGDDCDDTGSTSTTDDDC